MENFASGYGQKRLSNIKDPLLFFCFLFLWIFPLFYVGAFETEVPSLPKIINYLSNASCLFTKRMTNWRLYYMEAFLEDRNEWVTLPEDDYFRMPPFGYHTRLDELLDYIDAPSDYRKRGHLATWVKERYARLHPNSQQPIAVRFIKAWWMEHQEVPSGHWKKPRLTYFSTDKTEILSTHYFSGRRDL